MLFMVPSGETYIEFCVRELWQKFVPVEEVARLKSELSLAQATRDLNQSPLVADLKSQLREANIENEKLQVRLTRLEAKDASSPSDINVALLTRIETLEQQLAVALSDKQRVEIIVILFACL
jgi:hypothetical protein